MQLADMLLPVQFLVLGFTFYVWWLARRDLTQRAGEAHAPAVQEWERLRETVETLISNLERRAIDAEQRVSEAETRAGEAERRLRQVTQDVDRPPSSPLEGRDWLAQKVSPTYASPLAPPPVPTAEQELHQAHYAPVYALMEAGVTDAAEIARRTGLGIGEVELLLGLHGRRPHL